MTGRRLTVVNREFGKFNAELEGTDQIKVTGEYNLRIRRRGLIPIPVTATVNELEFGGKTLIKEQSVSNGLLRRVTGVSFTFEQTYSRSAQPPLNICDGLEATVKIDEEVSGVVLSNGYTEEVKIDASSPECNLFPNSDQ